MDAEDMWDEHPELNVFTKAELQQLGMLELADANRASLTNAIHPIFLAPSWVNVRIAHHTQLRPVLRLASQYITDPHLLPFWHAQLFGQRIEIPRSVVVGPIYGHTLSIFQRDYDFVTQSYALSRLDLVRTREALVSLAGFITFTINREPGTTGAVLTTMRDFVSASPTSFPGTASLIEIDRKYLDAYARPDLTISQRLRLQFFLAVSLVHEVGHRRTPSFVLGTCCSTGLPDDRRVAFHTSLGWQGVNRFLQLSHAIEMAVTPMLPQSPNRHGPTNWKDRHHPDEPFFERDRLAECGNAWENTVLGGLQNGFGSTVIRYGLVTRKWPTITDPAQGFELPIRGKPKKWTSLYFVPMSHIQKLFTDQFWSHEGIGRYGAGAVKSKRIYGWRAFNEGEVTSDSDEGISWGDSSREREADPDGKIKQPPFKDPAEDTSVDPFQFIDWTGGQGGE
jgi:hypothetical protein